MRIETAIVVITITLALPGLSSLTSIGLEEPVKSVTVTRKAFVLLLVHTAVTVCGYVA